MSTSIGSHKTLLLLSVLFLLMTSCAPRWIQGKRAKFYYEEGQKLLSKGELDRAMQKFERSRALAESAGFKAGVAHNLNEMAVLHTLRGKHRRARETLTQALEIYRELDMTTEISKVLYNIAETYISVQDFEGAVRQYDILLAWDRQTQNRLGEAITLRNMAYIYAHFLSRQDKAHSYFQESLRIFKALGQNDRALSVEKDMEKALKIR